METVSMELINKIYAHVNCIEETQRLMKDRPAFDKLICALRTLEDTTWAIEYYLNNNYPDDFKGKYLFTYGILQALFVQENAANSLNKVLCKTEIDYKSQYPAAYNIREIRNDVIGHPTNRKDKCINFFLHQCSITKASFCYTQSTWNPEKEDEIHVDLYSAINDVALSVNSVLRSIITKLELDFKQYIELHKHKKMKLIFEDLPLLYQSFTDNRWTEIEYQQTRSMVQRCKDELVQRYESIDVLETVENTLAQIQHLYLQIDCRLLDAFSYCQADVDKQNGLIEALFQNLFDLKMYCEEIDERFEHPEVLSMDSNNNIISPGVATFNENSGGVPWNIDA